MSDGTAAGSGCSVNRDTHNEVRLAAVPLSGDGLFRPSVYIYRGRFENVSFWGTDFLGRPVASYLTPELPQLRRIGFGKLRFPVVPFCGA